MGPFASLRGDPPATGLPMTAEDSTDWGGGGYQLKTKSRVIFGNYLEAKAPIAPRSCGRLGFTTYNIVVWSNRPRQNFKYGNFANISI